jgi:hypothetical protein
MHILHIHLVIHAGASTTQAGYTTQWDSLRHADAVGPQ